MGKANFCYICEECGSMDWTESYQNSYAFSLSPKLEFIQSEEQEGDEAVVDCAECLSDNVYYITINKDNEKDIKKLLKMKPKEKLVWLKKWKILEGLK